MNERLSALVPGDLRREPAGEQSVVAHVVARVFHGLARLCRLAQPRCLYVHHILMSSIRDVSDRTPRTVHGNPGTPRARYTGRC